MKPHYRNILSLLLIALLLNSCKEEPVPAYVFVDQIAVTTNATAQGSSSSNISDVWIQRGGEQLGVYEMPIEFPVVGEGPVTLLFFGGIKQNGMSGTRVMYPFYIADTFQLNLEPGLTDTVYPIVEYNDFANFALIENFENGNSFTNVQRVLGVNDVFEGSASGQIEIDGSEIIADLSTWLDIPYNSTAVFVELDYKSTHVFHIGIKSTNSSFPPKQLLSISPRSEWNKIYINLTPEVNQFSASQYAIYFRVAQGSADINDIKILLDNIKIIHFGET